MYQHLPGLEASITMSLLITQSILVLSCYWQTASPLVIQMLVDKSVVPPGQTVGFALNVDPKWDIVCIINFGDGECCMVLDEHMINVEQTSTQYGVSKEHVFHLRGQFTCNVICEAKGATAESNISIAIPFSLTGLRIVPEQENRTVELKLVHGDVQGTVNFTFQSGSHLGGTFSTDEGIEGKIVIDEFTKSGFVPFSTEDFQSFGQHVVNITMFNVYNNSNAYFQDIEFSAGTSLLQTVQYEELITDVALDLPTYSPVDSTVNLTTRVGTGSNVNITWTCESLNPCWDRAYGHSQSYNFTKPGQYNISVSVTNVYGSEKKHQLLHILSPVQGFSVSVLPPNSTTYGSLYLSTPSNDTKSMGELQFEIKDDRDSMIVPKTKLQLTGKDTMILERIPIGNKTLYIRIFSPISNQLLNIQVNIQKRANVPPFSVHSDSVIGLPDGRAVFTVRSLQPNISLSDSINCAINFNDFSPLKVLPFLEILGSGVSHTFLNGGIFNVTFICQNEVSSVDRFWVIEVKPFKASDFEFSYTSNVAWNSSGDGSQVVVHIDLLGLYKIPQRVRMQWDFGDGTSIKTYKLQSWVINHTFPVRGHFNMTVNITTDWGDTYSRVLPIRIGLLHFTAFPSVAYLLLDNVTFSISGVYGKSVRYKLDYGDGNSDSFERNDVEQNATVAVSKRYTVSGVFQPRVIAWGETFTEEISLPKVITVIQAVPNISLYIEPEISYPPGESDLMLVLNQPTPLSRGTRINCVIDFDDGSSPAEFSFEPLLETPFVYTHTFSAVGKLSVRGNCTIGDGTTTMMQNHTYVVSNCYASARPFSILNSVMKSTVNERLIIAATPDIRCVNITPEFTWKIERNGVPSDLRQPNSTVLVLQPRSMKAGIYRIVFYTNFLELPTIFISDSIVVEYEETPLQANIKGGNYKTFGNSEPVVIDAMTFSYDPDVEPGDVSDLNFSWKCSTFNSVDEAYRSLSREPHRSRLCADADLSKQGLLIISPGCLQLNKWYKFVVTVSKGNRKASNYQIIHIAGNPLQVDLRCKVNCLNKVDAEFSLSLETECVDCTQVERQAARYSWRLYKSDSVETPRQHSVPLDDITSTGSNISALSIRPNSLIPGKYYSVELTISSMRGRSSQTLGYNFMVNFPPYNGTCFLRPAEGVAVLGKFQVSCSGWVDEGYKLKRSEQDDGDFLTYQFILNAGNKSSELFAGGSGMTSWQEFNPGLKEDDYKVQITVRIFDRHKGVAEMNLTGRVVPPIRTSDSPVSAEDLDETLNLFHNKISLSLIDRDVHRVFRTTESVASVLNSLAVTEPSSALNSPDVWLEDNPPDIPRDNGTAPSWSDLWGAMTKPETEDQLEQVTKATRGYSRQLVSLLNDTRLPSMAAVRMASTSVGSLADISDQQGLEYAVDTMDVVRESLQPVVTTETSDVQVTEALNSVLTSVDNTMAAMLKESPVEEHTATSKETRRILERHNSYLADNELSKAHARQEMSDLHQDERVFLITRASLLREYKFAKRSRMVKSKLSTLLRTVDQTLDVASTFLVEGQEPAKFQSSQISVSVEKNQLSRLLNGDYKMGGVNIMMSLGNDSLLDETQRVKLKTTIHDRNPYVYEKGPGNNRVSSKTVRVGLTQDDGDNGGEGQAITPGMMFTVDVHNPAPVPISTVSPKYIALDHDQMLYHKTELKSQDDNLVIYVQPSSPAISYTVYFRSGEFPTSSEYHFRTSVHFRDETSLRLKSVRCPAGVLPSNGTIYIGLKPIVLETEITRTAHDPYSPDVMSGPHSTSDNTSQLLHAPYDIGIATAGCRMWDDLLELWNPDICLMVDASSDFETRCKCEQSNSASFTIGTTFYVPVNRIDFSTVFSQIDLLDNSGVFAVVISLFVIYMLLAVWARRKDKKDIWKWGVTSLEDNWPQDRYLYIVTVYTGMRLWAGTESRVGFVISGELADTGIRVLSDGVRKGLERQSIVHHLMAVPSSLGDLQYIRVWHDNSGKGSKASWFVHKFVVEDIQRERRFVFHCGRWLALDEDDGAIERLFPVAQNECRVFRKLFYNNARKNVTDNHLWLSVVLRPQRSHFTRFQRLSTCLCFLFLAMISNAIFFHSEENIVRPTAINIGFLRFSLHELYVSVIGTLIVTPVNIVIIWLFNKSKPSSSTWDSGDNPGSGCTSTCSGSGVNEDQLRLADVLVAKGFYQLKSLSLPHFCVYIAWTILFLSTGTSAFFLFLFSQQWGKTKSEEWITSFLLSFIESLLVVDPLKVILIALIMALFVRKQDNSDTEGLSSEVKSKSLKNDTGDSHSGIKGGNLSPLMEEELGPVRVKKKKEAKAMQVVKEILLYLIFLLVLYTLGYANRDPRSFNSKNNIYKMMVYRQNDKRLGLANVVTKRDLFKWLNLTALPALFHEQYYNGARRSWRDRYYMKDLQNFRVGPPILRQVRGGQMYECLQAIMSFALCNTEYTMRNGESKKFCLGWKDPPCPDEEKVTKLTSAAWEFTPASDIWGMPVFGRYNSYAGGGYIAQLDVNRDVSVAMLDELYSELWIDRQTRALALEFTVYNANSNMFSYVSLLVEFPELGGTMTQASVAPFRIYHHVGALGSYILLNEIAFLIFLCIAIIHFSLQLRKHGLRYMDDCWHIGDLICILASIVGISMYAVREVMALQGLDRLHDDPRQFVNFQHITVWDEVMVDFTGIVSSIVTVRTLNILGYSRSVSAITRVLTNASRELFLYSIIFSVVFFGFVILGYLLFGTDLEAYHTILFTCSTLLTSMIGKTPFDEMRRAEPLLAQAYFALFVFFVVLVLLTMFLAILNDSIAVVRGSDRVDSDQPEMVMLLLRKFQDSLRLFFPSIANLDKKTTTSKHDTKGKDCELLRDVVDTTIETSPSEPNRITNSANRPVQYDLSQPLQSSRGNHRFSQSH